MDAHVGLPRTEVMLSELLRQRGYATACIGKWLVGHQDGHRPLDRGFDRFYGFLGASHDYFKPSVDTDTDGEMYEGSWIWDQNIGRLQRELFLRGLDRNTIIVFASDNGGNEYEEPTGIRTVEHNGGSLGTAQSDSGST